MHRRSLLPKQCGRLPIQTISRKAVKFPMAKQHWKGSVLLAPVPPTLVTCGTMEHPNVLTVAWTGVLATHPPMTYISVRPTRYSYDIIREHQEFVINLPTSSMMQATDFCGVRSGRDTDKFAVCGLTPEPAQTVQAPLIAQCPVSLECHVTSMKELGTHTVFEAEITGVNVEEAFLDSKGKLNLQQCGLLAYAHGEYFSLGRKLGNFGDSVRKKKKHKKAPAKKKTPPAKK